MTGALAAGPLSPRVGVVILTWNARAHTQVCLDSLFGETTWAEMDVVVVDNGSTDGTLEDLRSRDKITLIENGENLGYAKGCNIGLAALDDSTDVIFLNNDIRITDSEWIGKLRDLAYSASEIGIVGCRLIDTEGRINHAGAFMRPVEMIGENIGGMEDAIGQYQENREVEAVMGAVMYVKRSLLDLVGAFDEEYFSYYEDTDLCYRAREAGYSTWYAGGLTLEHAYNVSRRENDFDYWAMYESSGKIFSRKWRSWIRDHRKTAATWHSTLHHPIGYAQVAREEMRALYDLDLDVSYESLYVEGFEGNTGDGLIDDLKQLEPRADSIHVAAGTADLWGRVGAGRKVGYTMLEVDGIPKDWVEATKKMDEIWVPTEFNRQTFEESGVTKPIQVIPLGVDTDHFNPEIRPYRRFDDFIFLSVSTWGERKAPEILLQAFNAEFGRDDGVALLFVCTHRDPAVDVMAEIDRLRLDRGRAPIIISFNPSLEGYQMGSLYRSADAFALATKGEGWGMPILEAMACGLPVITTGWSGQTAYFDDSVGYPIEVQTMEPAIAKCEYYEGFNWALPDLEHLRAQMRHVFENRAEAEAKGRAAATRAASLSWRASAEKVRERLEALS